MKLTLLFVALFVFAISAEDFVIVGTTENFNTLISENEFVLAEFYAPWCGHCKNLEPEYKKAAALLNEQGSPIKLVKVDATVETELGSTYDVRGYPTLKFFRAGHPVDYEGERSAEGIVSWVTKKSGPPTVTLTDDASIEAFVAEKPAVVGKFAGEDTDLTVFVAAAQVNDDFRFGNQVGAVDATIITLYTVDEGEKVYSGEMTSEALNQWLVAEGFPVLQKLDQNVWQRSSNAQQSLFVAFVDPADEAVMAIIQEVASANKGVVSATYMDSNENAQLAERWGASGKSFPTAVIISYATAEPALITWDEENEAEFSAAALSAFIAGALDGTYQSYRKSEPIPETNDAPVTVIVGKTFDEIVFDTTKDVLVEFYAPWCGHCKKLAPIYDELGEKFAGVDSVVIAKIDATANTFPESLDVRGFPTLYFFPAGENAEPVLYEGERELENFVEFIKANAATDVVLAQHEDL